MKNIPLPVFLMLVPFAVLTWWLNRGLQRIIQPRVSMARLLLYMISGAVLVLTMIFTAVRLILWLFPPTLK